MPKVKINDISLYYESYGQGEPLVFVAGFSGDHTAWQNIIDNYSKNYQVIVFDNRGSGQSDCPNYFYTTAMMADDIAGLIKYLALEPVHIVGHSFGGCIVQTVAYHYPELIKSVVVANTFIKANMRLKLYSELRLELIKSRVADKSVIKFISILCWSNHYLSQPGMIDQLIATGFFPITIQGYESQLHAMLTFDSQTWINQITKPCLVICADEDLLADVEDSQRLANSIKGSEYFCFKKIGHVPQIEQPDEFNKLIQAFISKHL